MPNLVLMGKEIGTEPEELPAEQCLYMTHLLLTFLQCMRGGLAVCACLINTIFLSD